MGLPPFRTDVPFKYIWLAHSPHRINNMKPASLKKTKATFTLPRQTQPSLVTTQNRPGGRLSTADQHASKNARTSDPFKGHGAKALLQQSPPMPQKRVVFVTPEEAWLKSIEEAPEDKVHLVLAKGALLPTRPSGSGPVVHDLHQRSIAARKSRASTTASIGLPPDAWLKSIEDAPEHEAHVALARELMPTPLPTPPDEMRFAGVTRHRPVAKGSTVAPATAPAPDEQPFAHVSRFRRVI